MPRLSWDSKTKPAPIPASLELDSVIFPQGKGYPDAITENRLILGVNLIAMSALLPEYEGE
jgi:hypothetical protein